MLSTFGTALVTGAGLRVGRALACYLGARGYRVAVHYRSSRTAAQEVVSLLCANDMANYSRVDYSAAAFSADLSRERETRELIDRVVAWSGEPVSLLVNNASIFERDEWDSVTPERWHQHLAVNLEAPYILARCVGEGLLHASDGVGRDLSGVIVNMIDQRVLNLTPHFVSYSVSKYGLLGLTRVLALALAPRVRVVGIGLGQTLASAKQSDSDFMRKASSTPLGEAVSLEDVCCTLGYILDSRSLTGQMIALDGGEHLGWHQANQGI